MSLPRHGEIFPYDEGTTLPDRALAHRLDESPAGYSWRVALQRGPLPLHQPASCCNQNTRPLNAKAANGKLWVNQFSQSKGPLQEEGASEEKGLRNSSRSLVAYQD